MVIHVYTTTYNDEIILPFFLRHYSLFADKIFVIDDGSKDKTLKIAKKNDKVVLLDYPFLEGYDEDDHNNCLIQNYKKYSQGVADWVMFADSDEFLYHEDIVSYLQKLKTEGAKITRARGFSMFSNKLPVLNGQIYEELFFGLRERRYDKPVIFDPSLNVVFTSGRHKILEPEGLASPKGEIKLLHYRWLTRDFFEKRSTVLLARVGLKQQLQKRLLAEALEYYDKIINTRLDKIV